MNHLLKTGCLLLCCAMSTYSYGGDKSKKIMNTTAQNKEIVTKVYDCLNNRNTEPLRDIIADDYAGIRNERGYQGFLNATQPVIQAFPDVHWNIEDMIAEGDKVVVRWQWTGTNKNPFQHFAATGKAMTNTAIAIYEIRDGKIHHAWMQTDRLGFLQQLGAVDADITAPQAKR
ncbi:MAG: ester cyclase [Flavipsychrobacter sp.]